MLGFYILATTAAAGDVGTTSAESVSLTAAAQTFTGASTTVPAETVNSLTAAAQAFTGTASISTSSDSAGTPAGTNTLGAFTEGAISYPVNVPTQVAGSFTQPTIAWPSAPTNVPTNAATATSGNCAATNVAIGTGATNACKATAPNLTVPAETISWPAKVPVASSGAFTQGAISWPANPPTIAAGSFTQPTFTGSALGTHSHTLTPAGTNGTSAVTGTLNSTTVTPLGANGTSAVTGTVTTAYIKLIPCSKN